MSATLSRQQLLAFAFFPVLAIAALSAPVAAQCANVWLGTPALPGTDGLVAASIEWDPDGPGPRTPVVVFGGDFTFAGGIATRGIVTHDPLTGEWAPIGDGIPARIRALAVLPNGDLVAGGSFTIVGGMPANNIARWDGTAWLPLGAGLDVVDFPFEAVTSLVVMPNGDLIAAGDFTRAGGVTASHIARWNGSSWSPLGQGLGGPPFSAPTPQCMALLPNGNLVVGGNFTTAGGVSAGRIAVWNGASWSAMGSGVGGVSGFTVVDTLLVLPNGDLVAGGLFTSVDGVSASNIARWNGVSWAPLGSGVDGRVLTIATLPNGDLAVGGDFVTAGGVPANRVARWDGAVWSAIGVGFNSLVFSLLPRANGEIVAGGLFGSSGGQIALRVARWGGTSWSPLNAGIAGSDLYAALALPNGEVVAGGAFGVTGVLGTPNVAQWDGTAWLPLGTGTDAAVHALARLPNGDVIAGGDFTVAGGVAVNRVARWNGTAWSSIGATLQQLVRALVVLPNGDLAVGGAFPGGVVLWNGTTWSSPGVGVGGEVRALAVMPNGDLVAAGSFTTAGGVPANGVARWSGTSWSPLGAGAFPTGYGGEVRALAVLPNGDLVCGGYLPGHITRWDGANWSWPGALPDNQVSALAVLPDGDLVVSGGFGFVGALESRGLARWDGAAWSAMDWAYPHWPAAAIASLANGDLIVAAAPPGGCFVRRLATTCPALAGVVGLGCAGTGGANVLTAQSLPWIGSTYRSEATGMPANGFAFVVLGFGSLAIPLASLSPQGGPGCDLQVTIDVLDALPIVAGRVAMAIAIPDTTAFVGITVRQQVLPVELGLAGNVVGFTATNPLAVTIGAF